MHDSCFKDPWPRHPRVRFWEGCMSDAVDIALEGDALHADSLAAAVLTSLQPSGGAETSGLVLPARPGWEVALKRAIDVTVSLVALVVGFPLLLAIGLAVLIADGRPIFFP